VTGNPFLKLRDWLTIDDAAEALTAAMAHPISEADVLRLTIDGHLQLSLYLPGKMTASCHRKDDQSLDPLPRQHSIQGLCDVPMSGRAKLQIEHEYHWLEGTYVPREPPVGALVEHGELVCRLPFDRGETGFSTRSPSEFPQGSVLAIRRAALDAFIAQHHDVAAVKSPQALERPLGERERSTLLTIIAALAKAAGVDITKPGKAGAAIEALTVDVGARVAERTVIDHLNRIPEALERRKKEGE
jgi:hypothetical protein